MHKGLYIIPKALQDSPSVGASTIMLSLYVYMCISIKQNLLYYLHSQIEWFHSHSSCLYSIHSSTVRDTSRFCNSHT